jgi:hypothetical protein
MSSRLRDLVGRCLVTLALGCLLATEGRAAEAVTADSTDPAACAIASIGGAPVTVADAERLRALLSPPPSRDAARRLAIDSALAWWDLTGSLGDSTPKERLEAWRRWLVRLGQQVPSDELGMLAVERLAAVARRAGLERAGLSECSP